MSTATAALNFPTNPYGDVEISAHELHQQVTAFCADLGGDWDAAALTAALRHRLGNTRVCDMQYSSDFWCIVDKHDPR